MSLSRTTPTAATVNDTRGHPPALLHDDEGYLGQLYYGLLGGAGNGSNHSSMSTRSGATRYCHPTILSTNPHLAAVARRRVQTFCGCHLTLLQAVHAIDSNASNAFVTAACPYSTHAEYNRCTLHTAHSQDEILWQQDFERASGARSCHKLAIADPTPSLQRCRRPLPPTFPQSPGSQPLPPIQQESSRIHSGGE